MVEGHENAIQCARCGHEYLHRIQFLHENRCLRDEQVGLFECEGCHAVTRVSLQFYKGQTFLVREAGELSFGRNPPRDAEKARNDEDK